MEISSHNIRQVITSSDMVSQAHRGELNHGQGVAPSPTVPEKPGDTSKVVLSRESESLQNDLQEKPLMQQNDKKKNKKNEEVVIDTEEKDENPPDVGVNLDING